MSGGPLVSVITIFLNGAKYLEDAIESVFGQTYTRWELLLVDDGSTDGSTAIARRYAEQHPAKVRYLEHPGHQNKGMSASRNLGIAQARGELLAFIDDDDVWLPRKLELQVAIMSDHPRVALVLNCSDYWYPDQGLRKPRQMTLAPGPHPPGAWPRKILEDGENVSPPCGVLVRRGVAVEVGGFEESFRDLFEDQVMWYKIGLNAPVYYDPERVALYRQHAGSCWSSTPADAKLLARLQFYSWAERYVASLPHDRLGPVLSTVQAHLRAHQWQLYVAVLRQLLDAHQFPTAHALVHCLEQQLSDPPQSGEWHYLVAFSLHQAQTRLPEALQRYNRALEYGFDEFWVRYNRGALHKDLGNLSQAREDLTRAVALQPQHEGAQQMLRQLLEAHRAVPPPTSSSGQDMGIR